MNVCQANCCEKMPCDECSNADGSSSWSNCLCCGEKFTGDLSTENTSKTPDVSNRKLKKSNILDKLQLKLNKLNELNAQVNECNEVLEGTVPAIKAFKDKKDFEKFLTQTYNEKRYSYCVINCQPTEAKRYRKPTIQISNMRIPRNMGWNWKLTHSENWQPGALPKIVKMRMSHFLNYYPCDTLPISRMNIKLSKNSFNDGDNRVAKIKKMIQSIGFSPCFCNKSVAWCMCREKGETIKLKNMLEQIEQQIGESGLEYKLYLNDSGKQMSSIDRISKSIPDLVCEETQYEPMDFNYLEPYKKSWDRLSKPKHITNKVVPKLNNHSTANHMPSASNVSFKNSNTYANLK